MKPIISACLEQRILFYTNNDTNPKEKYIFMFKNEVLND
jgi:hypothetical protein